MQEAAFRDENFGIQVSELVFRDDDLGIRVKGLFIA